MTSSKLTYLVSSETILMAFPAFTLHFRAHNIMKDGYRDENTCDKLLNDGCYVLVRHQHLERTTMFMFNHRSWLHKCSEDKGKTLIQKQPDDKD